MAVTTRPGGLTALAILNFFNAAVGCLLLAGLAFWCVVLVTGAGQPEVREAIEKSIEQSGLDRERLLLFFVFTIIGASFAILFEFIAGIGYLGQRRLLGRWCGNLYAVIAVANVIFSLRFLPRDVPGGGFTIGTMIGLAYPVYTVILINTIFRRDFVRR